jgi:type III restriction enzyme
MKLKFKVQPYQTNAVEAVVDCFAGQPFNAGTAYRVDPGAAKQAALDETGFKNADLMLTEAQILDNIREVQKRQNLPLSSGLADFTVLNSKKESIAVPAAYKRDALAASRIHLDIEMETGTGKTYCYIKTIFELNKRYGWNKFIIMVPSIAIREGVYKSLEITADHFTESYGKKARFFIYNSKQLHHLESFSSDAGINVMVINIQAFAAKGADNRRIYDELDDFQSRRPIDVISSNRPILILDEPQKMEGKATLEALPKFKPLAILRYSATHKTQHNKIHRLDALDAYNQKLVKKIAVRGISMKGLAGSSAYLYLESIEISKQAPVARIEMEIKHATGEIKRKVMHLSTSQNLYDLSNKLDQYQGFVISQIDAREDTVEFTNGHILNAGEATGDVTEATIRRIQIRETIKAHLEKEQKLFSQGIKVLSLFFIDEVSKYRDYSQPDEQGEYARIFEEEYETLKAEYLGTFDRDGHEAYREHLTGIDTKRTHEGYFSIDKKTKRLKDPEMGAKVADSDDVDAYDLILKNKERLLSFAEPVRFIFSHSALREGWDNPNVFVMCMLKHSDNTISRRQEVGRGLRLSVNQNGDRMDHPATVHEINVLTVVASESYKIFVANLQEEISDALSARPRKADEAYFTGKIIKTETGTLQVTEAIAKQVYKYLLKNDYTDDADHIAEAYHAAKKEQKLAALPEGLIPYAEQIFLLIDSVFSASQLPPPSNAAKEKINPLNSNFDKKEFQEFWSRINHKAVYRVEFDSAELIAKCIKTLNKELRVSPLQYTIQTGIQEDQITDGQLKAGESFQVRNTVTESHNASLHSSIKYDLLGKIAENVQLTRKTVAEIFKGMEAAIFGQFKQNPEHFIAEAARLIKEQKATIIIERLCYDEAAGIHDVKIFTTGQSKQDFTKTTDKLKKHIYDYVITDSKVERDFVRELDTSAEVTVYAKLPKGFLIPTPVGDYNPDWAISFKEGSVKYIYFVAETKGSMSSMELREIEKTKIECARKFFDKINQRIAADKVKYDVIDSYGRLMDVVGVKAA